MGSNLLARQDVSDLAECSLRTVQRTFTPEIDPAGEVAANGKGVPVYPLAGLPAELQQKWAREQQRKVVEIAPGDGAQMTLALTIPVGPNLSDADRAEATRRFGVIEPLLNREKYHFLYVQYPRRGELVQYLAGLHSTTLRTVYRWLAAWEAGGLPALVRRDRSDKGFPKLLSDAARDLLISLAMPRRGVYGALSVAEMWRVYEEERAWRRAHTALPMGEFERDKYARYLDEDNRLMATAQLAEISYETFRVWFNRIPEMVRELARNGNEAYHNTQGIISHRDIAGVEPMDYVVMDHRRLDVFCLLKDGAKWKLARPWLTAAIDMRTRKWLAWAIVETPSSDSIATVLKRVFIDHGLPKALYWDNGKDFRCEWFEGKRRRTRLEPRTGAVDGVWGGVLGTLGIRVTHAIVRNARAKLIEPNFGRVSNFDRTLPEWCGHQPGARPERFDELVKEHEQWTAGLRKATPFRTIEQIASLYNAAMRDLNERPLEGDGMRKILPTGRGWLCPNEAWELLIGKVARRTVPLDVLHMCFDKRKELMVRNGELSTTLGGQIFRYRMADNSLRLMQLNGKTVQLAYDPLDMAEAAVYYESRFFGLARCVELRRMGEQGFVKDERDRRGAKREIKRAIAVAHALAPVASPEERLARRAEVAPDRSLPDGRGSVAVELSDGVIEAAAARAEEVAFRFLDAGVGVEKQESLPDGRGSDDEFKFFQGD
jgi:transposase InsO family protein